MKALTVLFLLSLIGCKEESASTYQLVQPLAKYRDTEPTLLMEERGGKFRVVAKVRNPKIGYDPKEVDALIKAYDDAVARK